MDPLARTFPKLLKDGVTAGVGQDAQLAGIFELGPLNTLLQQQSQPGVAAAGLD